MTINSKQLDRSSPTTSFASCGHQRLILLPKSGHRLRCCRCKKILPPETSRLRFCPSCYATDGFRQYTFMETNIIDVSFARYRCEDCGMMIHAR
ncbi:hypothetical protein dsmv_2632 [Desulfococcus multivorans DSM 2059]|jgi:hypothetical protein|uniref:Uncharacterized protein n=1 Tax=Desulfococcus multivorans DSM 2059 TaxID=1121405 RepID=S7TRJ6_DESML|nr:hypothetical protein dsmv_2632 [Desulfococcus multivorans DSM 2059]SKA12223.1 hypothetical protein SAMN02745446_02852 [Desulfococcus multivorans DSM 2059]